MTKDRSLSSDPLSAEGEHCPDDLSNPDPHARSRAATMLGELRVRTAVPCLVRLLREDVNTYVRSAAAEALGHIGDRAAVFPLIDATRDGSSYVRRAAAIALGQLQAKEAQVALLRLLGDTNFYVRRAAINAIGKLGIPDLARMITPFLDADDPRLRRTAVTALRRLGAREAIPKMTAMLREVARKPSPHDLPLVKALVLALGRLQAEEAVPVLIEVVRGYVGARSMASAALGQIGDRRACPVLAEALRDRSASLRLAALKSLGRLRCREAAPLVRPFLDAPDTRQRRIAAFTIACLGDRSALPRLVEMALADESPIVRPVAVEALGRLGDPAALPPLLSLVDDPNAYLRAALAYALGALDDGSEAVEAALRRLADDAVEHVAEAARRVLAARQAAQAEPVPAEVTESASAAQGGWLSRLLGR